MSYSYELYGEGSGSPERSPEPSVSSVIKWLDYLEDQHLNGDPGANSPTVPTKILDSKMMSSGFGDESGMLQSELRRLEDLLAATRAERDEIGSKCMALSDKLEQYRKGGTSPGSAGYSSFVQKISYFEDKLKRKFQAYQDGKQRQAQLIQKLQQKVLQYKRKCGELERSVSELKTSKEKQLRSANETLKEQEAKLKETEEERARRQKAEEQLRELQNKFDNEKTDLMVKVKDLTNGKDKLEAQIYQREETIKELKNKIIGLLSQL